MNQPRIFFLDNLRAAVIFLVVVLHGALSYMAYAPEWWYVLNPERNLFFTVLVLLIDVPIMQIMFFVAGYFAYPSLAKRGPTRFFGNKFRRVGVPWIFGVLFLAPPTAYMIYYSRNIPVPFLQFWANDFWGPVYQQSVYWYLGVLFLFFGLLSLVFSASEKFREITLQRRFPTWKLFAGFIALMSAGFLVLNLFFPADTWTHVYLFVFQPLRVPLYVGYFSLGLVAYQQRWFVGQGYSPRLWVWMLLFVVSGMLYLVYRLTIPTPAQTTLLLKAGNAVLFNTFCLSGLLAGAGFFQQYINGNATFWRSQARNSYGIYYIHPFFVYPLAYIFIPAALPVFVKAVVVIAIGWLLSWGFCALVLTRVPGLRDIF